MNTVKINNKQMKEKLHKEGYKFTKQREAIFEVMLDNFEKHLSCDDIFDMVKEDYPEIGIATVYRTLQLFDKIDIVQKVDFDDGFSRYELCTGKDEHNHHHLICVKCGKVMEVKLDLLETLEDEIEKNGKFKILDHNVKFYGHCSDCQS